MSLPRISLSNAQGARDQRLGLGQLPRPQIHIAESLECAAQLEWFGCAVNFLLNCQSLSEQRFGSRKVAANAVKPRQVAQCGSGVRVFCAKNLFAQPECAEEQRLCPRKIAQLHVQVT